jgi:2-polyprenyl-3-methyl-5-hydroxy-6-metoxy-1,4-benzoquinol methylase
MDEMRPHSQAYLEKRAGTCLVCDGALAPHERLKGLLRCQICGFVTADLTISSGELQAIYGRDYFHGREYADYVLEGPSLKLNFRQRMQTLKRYVPEHCSKTLFEIGCAYGFFLELARNEFMRVCGVDISDDAVRYAKELLGVNAVKADFVSAEIGEGFDVYCLWDTIEHLIEPNRVIAKISKVMNPQGIVAITTGDIGSPLARIQGRSWRMIHPPTHLHYFSRATLERLLVRHGFEVLTVEYPSTTRTLRMILSGLLVLGRPASSWTTSFYRALDRLPFLDLSIPLNTFDIMYVIARRRG